MTPSQAAHLNLIAKSIGELAFEQVINPVQEKGSFVLRLAGGAVYEFEGWITTWEHLRVKPLGLKRNGIRATNAGQFFIDSQAETGMDDITLGNFLEEMHDTLYSDERLQALTKDISVKDAAAFRDAELQSLLNGHPKLLLNKGRIGWGAHDLSLYSPEEKTSFQLFWVSVKNTLVTGDVSQGLLEQSFEEIALAEFLTLARDRGHVEGDFTVIPVHPWQWDRYIKVQFNDLIDSGEIIPLGFAGDLYRPQISLRTLSNVSRKEKVDIKLPLSILNTSCVRGLPARGMDVSPEVSRILAKICAEDPFLRSSGTEVARELAGVAVVHPTFAQVTGAPYRYHEFLGAVWRENPDQKGDKSILTAALSFQDSQGKSLIGEYIRLSGLGTDEWLRAYFETIVLPLYHLQLEYGVGMVAHGQNIILKLKHHRPSGLILKDFQGDLRLVDKLPKKGQEYFGDLAPKLTALPPHYLIHDLITGHFVSVLRFVSATMYESEHYPEEKFYSILSHVLREYVKNKSIPKSQDLLAPNFSRVLLNKVRFAIGYSDTAQRPLPLVGNELKNPLLSGDENMYAKKL